LALAERLFWSRAAQPERNTVSHNSIFPVSFQRALLPIFIVIYTVLSLYVMMIFMIGSNLAANNSRYGEPYPRPQAYRLLVPALTQIIYHSIPDVLEQALTPGLVAMRESQMGKKVLGLRYDAPQQALSDARIFETSLTLFVVYLTLLSFIWMLYVLARALFPESRDYALVAPVIALLLAVVTESNYAYTYDFAELFFSSACLYLLLKQRWILYLFVIVLAMLNKATAVFVIFFYFMWFHSRLPYKQYIGLGLLQLFLVTVTGAAVTLYFSDRPGVFLGTYFPLQNNLLSFYQLGYGTFVCGLVTVFFLIYRWHEKPAFLRGGLWMLVPHVPAFLVICDFREARDWGWSLPVLILLATHTLIRAAHLPDPPAGVPALSDTEHFYRSDERELV
jgi:hypothetical protein